MANRGDIQRQFFCAELCCGSGGYGPGEPGASDLGPSGVLPRVQPEYIHVGNCCVADWRFMVGFPVINLI